jgi:hypothetical protein
MDSKMGEAASGSCLIASSPTADIWPGTEVRQTDRYIDRQKYCMDRHSHRQIDRKQKELELQYR